MDRKSRYRLRLKLQSSLTRLVEVLGTMKQAEVSLSPANRAALAVVVDYLDLSLGRSSPHPEADQSNEAAEVADAAVEDIERTQQRRAKETLKRKWRHFKQTIKQCAKDRAAGPPKPPPVG